MRCSLGISNFLEEIRKSSAINAKKEENNRIRKTRDLFKKIRDTKGTSHAKMGLVKDRDGMVLRY